jgi:hypothetical protein
MDGKGYLFFKNVFLQSQLTISDKDKRALQDVSLFIATSYVKPSLGCSLAVKAPNQDLCFLKTLKKYYRGQNTLVVNIHSIVKQTLGCLTLFFTTVKIILIYQCHSDGVNPSCRGRVQKQKINVVPV